MADWLTNKGAGPWEFAKQSDKKGFSNNPLWVAEADATDRHEPCGYWLNGLYTRTSTDVIIKELVQGDAWVEKVSVYVGSISVYATLAVYNGRLFGLFNEGSLYRWNDTDAWELMASTIYSSVVENKLIVVGENLYIVGNIDSRLRVARYNVNTSSWTEITAMLWTAGLYRSSVSFNDILYVGTSSCILLRLDGDTFTTVADLEETGNLNSLCVYNDKLYAIIQAPNYSTVQGDLLEWNNSDSWVTKAVGYVILGVTVLGYSLIVYDNELYGFGRVSLTSHTVRCLKWNGIDTWELMYSNTGGFTYSADANLEFFSHLFSIQADADLLYHSEDVSEFTQVASGSGSDIYCSLINYNNKLYTISDGALYEFNSTVTERLTRVITEEIDPLEVDNAVWPFTK